MDELLDIVKEKGIVSIIEDYKADLEQAEKYKRCVVNQINMMEYSITRHGTSKIVKPEKFKGWCRKVLYKISYDRQHLYIYCMGLSILNGDSILSSYYYTYDNGIVLIDGI